MKSFKYCIKEKGGEMTKSVSCEVLNVHLYGEHINS